MRFTIICIGKLKEAYLRDGVDEFVKRCRPYGGIEIIELPEAKVGDKPKEAQRLQAVEDEGVRMEKLVGNKCLYLLDLHGKTLSSEALAADIQDLEVQGTSELVFVIGGAFGLSDSLRKLAKKRISLSPMTFTHQMVRLLLVEQIYRACKINRNEPYHW